MSALLPPSQPVNTGDRNSARLLEPTPLGGERPVLALLREGATLAGLQAALATLPRARAILIDGPTPLDWLDAILAAGLEVWFIQRRVAAPELDAWIVANRDSVRLMVGFVPDSQRLPELFDWMDALRKQDVRLQVGIEGLIAGVTDTRPVLQPLLTALAERGFQQISMSYLAIDPRVEAWLFRTHEEAAPAILAQYREGPRVRLAGRGVVQLLPRIRRQRGYASLLTLAAEQGLRVCISPLANPDFDRPRDFDTRRERPRLTEVYLAGGIPRPLGSLN